MACGVPVIGSRIGAVSEFLADGEAGVLVDPGDVAACAERLASLVADAGRRRALGTAARQRCEARYDARRNTAALIDLAGAVAGA